ncbi:hypothetical protein ABGB07_32665 [Micromonosporaceae bacterium B7E4]
MIRRVIACLAFALALVPAACSGSSDGPDPQASAPASSGPPTGAPSVPTAAALPTAASSADILRAVCRATDSAASGQLFQEALAIGGGEQGRALRVKVAATYSEFADRLTQASAYATGDLRQTLTEWASASVEVARFVAEEEPRRGLVIDYGPAQKRADTARDAAEAICGHPLPNSR